MKLTSDQQDALSLVKNGHSVVIIGQAGTGKTVLIREIDRSLRENRKKVSITASTGMAARQFQHGRTLHDWAGLSDGRFNNLELSNLLFTDEKKHVIGRIRSTDVLIIDEISMISRNVFDQLEYVCRTVKEPSLCFGGLQVICVGDFFQIPPQANDLYSDPGYHAFTSEAWQAILSHKISLTTVMRQKEAELIQVVNELENGTPSVETNNFMYRLSRPLPDTVKPVYLYARNFDVDCHNSVELGRLPGPIQSYQSQDLGDLFKLKKILAKRVLTLKINSPVMLIRNLSSELVNGMIGTIIYLEMDGPTVRFGEIVKKIEKVSFTVYDPKERKILSERIQFPINLAFAITIHKSQGQTIKNVVVDCRNIYQPGQIGVAVGRSVETSGLCVKHYTPSCCKKHKREVRDYCQLPGLLPSPDLSCCKKIHHGLDLGDDVYDATWGSDFEEGSDFNEEELKTIEDLEKTAIQEHPIIVEDVATRFTKSDGEALLSKLYCKAPMTAQQHNLNSDVIVLKADMPTVLAFLNQQYNKVMSMKENATKKDVVDWNKFFKTYHSSLSSVSYKSACVNLFSQRTVNVLMCGTLMSEVRKTVVAETQKKESSTSSKSRDARKIEINVSAHGKIRYVGGRSVAKVKYRYMKLVNNELNSIGIVMDIQSKTKVTLLQTITESQASVLETTQYTESTLDTFRKQNMACGLTNISDKAFEFFLHLEQKRIPLYDESLLTQHGIDLLQHVHRTMLEDKNLYEEWVKLFAKVLPSMIGSDEQDSLSCGNVIHDITETCVCIEELYENIVTSYLNVTDAEFRRKITSELGKHKMMEHRKQVLTKESKKAQSSLSMSSIVEDKSERKTASHFKLKGSIMNKESSLDSLTKKEIISLAKAYDTVLTNASKKEILIKKLSEKIITCNEMPFPSRIGDASMGDPAKGPKQKMSSLPQEPITISSDITSVEEINSDDSGHEEGKGKKAKRKGKGKGKGKGKTLDVHKTESRRAPTLRRRKRQVIKDDIEDICAICDDMYFDEDEKPWISCTHCERWFHRSCASISQNQWTVISEENADWQCLLCCK